MRLKFFCKNPVLLPPNLNSVDSSTTVKLLLDFSELCRLDVYLHVYYKFYVGSSNIDKNTSAPEVCREISDLRQEWKDTHGKLIVDAPEELFTKFLSLADNLPDSVERWPIQLCSTFYIALSRTISDRMMDSDVYTAPSLIGLDTKEKQLEALQIVREGTTAQHEELVAENECIDKKLKQMIKASGRNACNYFAGETEKSHQTGGRDEVIGQKNQGNYFTVGSSVIGEKSQGSA